MEPTTTLEDELAAIAGSPTSAARPFDPAALLTAAAVLGLDAAFSLSTPSKTCASRGPTRPTRPSTHAPWWLVSSTRRGLS